MKAPTPAPSSEPEDSQYGNTGSTCAMRVRTIAANLAWVAKNKAARILVAILTLVFVIAVPCKLAVTWLTCEWSPLSIESHGPHDHVDDDVRTAEPQFTPQWTMDASHVVFTARHWKPVDPWGETPSFPEIRVYVAASDGSRVLQISESDKRGVIDHSPSVSPDGSQIAFSSYRYVDEDKRYFELWTSMLDGSGRRKLTHEAGLDFAPEWLSNGDRIAFRRDSPCTDLRVDEILDTEFTDVGVYTMKSDGSDVRRLLPEKREQHVGDLAWSPDGQQVAIMEYRGNPGNWLSGAQKSLDIVDADGSNRRRLIEGKARLHAPAWSRDGARIAFTRFQDGSVKLFTIDPDGTALNEVADVPATGSSLSWSHDDSQIMITDHNATYKELVGLYVVKLDSLDIRNLGSGLYAAWSPNGSSIAISTPYGSDTVLYTRAADGTGVRILARITDHGMVGAADPGQWFAVDVASCSAGVVVPDPAANPGLVRDCQVLVEAIDRTGVTGLNWSPDSPMTEWEGVTVDASAKGESHTDAPMPPRRVRELSLGKTVPVAGDFLLHWVADLSGLRLLDLSGANLSGSIPPELGSLTKLVELDLSGNSLGGPIPSELGNLTALKNLDLGSNSLSGPVPPELGSLTKLVELDLSRNALGGPIPSELGNLAPLKRMDLSFNRLSGSIPPEWGNLSALETLNLISNANLGGCIPLVLKEQNLGDQPLGFCDQ